MFYLLAECAPEVKACWYQLKHRAVSSKFRDVEYEEVIVRKCADDGYEQNACEEWNFNQVQANRLFCKPNIRGKSWGGV